MTQGVDRDIARRWIQANVACTGVLLIQAWNLTAMLLQIFVCSGVISAVLNCKRTLSSHSSWRRLFLDILQDGDCRMFVTDIQANVACAGVLLIQAWSLIAMLLKIFVCRDVIAFRHVMDVSFIFPECVARVPVSLWGSGGWGCVRSTLLPRPQPLATVRNRSQPSVWGPYGRAYGKFCRGGPFWRFQTSGCFVSRGRRGTSWHSDVFWNVSKVVLRGRRNTFVTFSEDVLQFSWQAQHFGRVHRHFSWQAQHFRRVALRVFCKSHWQGCVTWRQGANSVAGVAFCDMCWKLTEASHETSILMLPIFGF